MEIWLWLELNASTPGDISDFNLGLERKPWSCPVKTQTEPRVSMVKTHTTAKCMDTYASPKRIAKLWIGNRTPMINSIEGREKTKSTTVTTGCHSASNP
jgi:hypothetical protein